MTTKKISIIVPTYNEQENIKKLLLLIHNAFNKNAQDYEIIVIDDHSTDNTWHILRQEEANFPLRIFQKQGKRGKSYSLLEGFEKASGNILAMIDADLQYLPSAIPQMARALDANCDVIVANRKKYHASPLRKILSRGFRHFFGNMLFGLNCDIQSGLKVFKKEVLETVKFKPHSAWTFDLEFLHRANLVGFQIKNIDITFYPRTSGSSQINVIKNGLELATNAAKLKLKRIHPQHIAPYANNSMLGAGVGYNRKKYITHTTLPHHVSALRAFLLWQKLTITAVLASLSVSFYLWTLTTAIVLVAILSAIYLIDVLFNFVLTFKSIFNPPEISFTGDELAQINDKQLPTYTILCPLYKEAAVLPHFLSALDKIDWPKDKLDILLLLEEDDKETQEACKKLSLPTYIRSIIVPESAPKTKPKACNYGLSKAKGEYFVIYDAEDIPEVDQLKKAYLAFQKTSPNIICLQAKLNYYNPHQNLLTRLFTAEYSLWFDVTLTGLQSIGTTIPLGGTSNHFRTADLICLQGWDPFNVTEDADLGVRLFREGFKTAIIDSTTLEEANSKLGNWFRQRSRWIKGYMQTYLVQMRNPISFVRQNGIHALFFQLTVGGKIAFMFINPFLWVATISYFALNHIVGPTIESLYPAPIFYMAIISLIFGNFMFMYYYMIGCAKREHWSLIKYVFLIPFYWLAISFAAAVAAYQLITKPHYWEKTVHGFHHAKVESDLAKVAQEQLRVEIKAQKQENRQKRFAFIHAFSTSKMATGGMLILATIIANFFNFAYNAYLGRTLSSEDFGLVSLVGSFLYLSSIPVGALGKTVTHRSAYILGRYESSAKKFWAKTRTRALFISFGVTALWLGLTPILVVLFKSDSFVPFIIFTPVWVIGILSTVDSGFLTGSHKFKVLAILTIGEAVLRFLFSLIFVELGLSNLVYAAVPIAMCVAFFIGWMFARSIQEGLVKVDEKVLLKFPKHFYLTSVLTKISTVAFLSFDVILAKLFLSPAEAGQYALLALVGKMIFFIGSLFSQFINPVVSREEGAQRSGKKVFYKLLLLTSLTSFVAYLAVGLMGTITVPILFGAKVSPVIYLLPSYGFAMLCFTIASSLVTFYQIRKKYLLTYVSFAIALAQVISISLHHQNLGEIVAVMNITGFGSLLAMFSLHFAYHPLSVFARNINDFFTIFSVKISKSQSAPDKPRILIFNWRDIKHVWAGGAEVYIDQIAKGFIKEGHMVTIFCGNDGKSARNDVVDGVNIVRRGGFYTVYIWAFLYYIFKFRRHFDLIIDCENGVPFFSPIYCRKPIIGLVHHVHQEVFRAHLTFPLAQIAVFLEGKLMPAVYKNIKMVTISKSSKEAMESLGFSSLIDIIHPGVNLEKFIPRAKTSNPSIFYLGRLKPYKSVDKLITAFSQVARDIPSATLTIAGEGESRLELEEMTLKLGLSSVVKFLGRVSEKAKAELLASSWILAQPSKIEGWGITVIEANASGTPVIASDVPGLRDSVRNPHTGLLVTWDNQEKWVDAMVKIISDENFRKSLEQGAQLWSKNFSWGKSVDNFTQIIVSECQRSKRKNISSTITKG